ncbi:MAG: hypothetical protein II410_02980 [Ruminococcus sp.]|nr:hypothetical protein [Ruminococcus sp.]
MKSETDLILLEIEARIKEEYERAIREINEKLNEHFAAFAQKDKGRREALKNGEITKEQCKNWRMGQLAVGRRWEEMRDQIALDFAHANQIANSIVSGYMPEVYAANFNYGTYMCEVGARVDTSFTLYNAEAVERLIRDNPKLLPDPGEKTAERIAKGQEQLWEKKKIQSSLIQSIIQGEDVYKIASRLAQSVGDSDYKAAIRNARTATTSAQNGGLADSFKRAENMGIKVKKTWLATLDGRTRHAHRQLDGVTIPVDDYFENEFGKIKQPGDMDADPRNLWNCRCTMIATVEGHERNVQGFELRNDPDVGGMTYEQWKEARPKYGRRNRI